MGGGLAGAVAALYLAERGARPMLLEAHPTRLGGRWRGGTEDEATVLRQDGQVWRFPSEHGLHGLWGEYHNLRAALGHFLGAEAVPGLVAADRQEWIYAAGGQRTAVRVELGRVVTHTWLPAPLHYLALFARPGFLRVMTPLELAALPWIFASLQLALRFNPLVRAEDADRLSRMRLRTFFFGWPPRLRAMVAALARSGLFADPEEAPLAGFVAFLRFYTLLRRDAQRFHYLPADPQTAVFGGLHEALVARGSLVRFNARVESLHRQDPDYWTAAWREDGALQSSPPGPVVLALDAPAAQQLLSDSPATRAVAENHVAWPRGLPNATVRLWWDDEPDDRYAEAGIFGGDFTGDNVFWLHRIQTSSPFSAWASATGGSACEVHVYGPDDVLAQPDAAIVARVAIDVRRAYPHLRGARLLQTHLRRNPATHTLFDIGSTSRHLEVDAPWSGIWLAGDWVRYPSPTLFLERATVTGLAAANGVLTTLGLEPWPIAPVRQPEPLARLVEWLWRLGRSG